MPEESLDRVHWSDLQPPPRAGQLPLPAHCTSIGTLERIAQAGEVWFSNPLYMNGVDELRYGTFDTLCTTFDNDSAFDVYVFSCSEHDDGIGDDGLLSMWRGYGGDGNGVAIVFDMGELLAARRPLLVRQVQDLSYEESESWMDAKLQQHRGFHEEREWRIVDLREQDREGLLTQQLHDAIGGRGIEPRLRFSTRAPGDAEQGPALQDMVRRIILGPVLATPLALRSVVRMLEIDQPAWTDRVARSSTPYRAQRL